MSNDDYVYLAWKSPDLGEWHVVGLLGQRNDRYTFNYTRGAQSSSKFITFSGMSDIGKTYISAELFPLFKNRLLSSRRPEYPNFIKWLGLDENVSPIDVLGRSGAIRVTDQLQMFKKVDVDENGDFEYIFFAHGLRHLCDSASERVSNLAPGEKLRLCSDHQNANDDRAVLIRADDPAEIVGYCPRYLAGNVKNLLEKDSASVDVVVEALAKEAPANYQLMCRLKGNAGVGNLAGFMGGEEFQVISELG